MVMGNLRVRINPQRLTAQAIGNNTLQTGSVQAEVCSVTP